LWFLQKRAHDGCPRVGFATSAAHRGDCRSRNALAAESHHL